MADGRHYSVKIDQLPEEQFEAGGDEEARQAVAAMIRTRAHLAILRDDEPVVIKRPDGIVLLRDGTLADFRGHDDDPAAIAKP